jgi:hypothetical protein
MISKYTSGSFYNRITFTSPCGAVLDIDGGISARLI